MSSITLSIGKSITLLSAALALGCGSALAGAEPQQPTACTLVTAAEMSEILGAPVSATANDTESETACVYQSVSGDGPYADFKVTWGDGRPALMGASVFKQVEPGVTDPLHGLGDEAAYVGPLLMIRIGEDLVTLTVLGVEDGIERAKRIIATMRPRMGASRQPTESDGGEGASADAGDGPGDLPPGAKDLLGGLLELAAGADAADPEQEALPEELAQQFDVWPTLDQPCPPAGPDAAKQRSHEASATIPLRVGMTMAHTWMQNRAEGDHECLYQVASIDAESVLVTCSCSAKSGKKMTMDRRRVCRADLASGLTYQTRFSPVTPETILGATVFSLSRRQFDELKTSGQTWQRYVEIDAKSLTRDLGFELVADRRGRLKLVGSGSRSVIVNDRPVALPVLQVEGTMRTPSVPDSFPVKLTVLDDARFPLVLDYEFPADDFSIHQVKITFPSEGALEELLATEKRADVYGIYFDTASATIRAESEPILAEIAALMREHPDWRLRIDGHTDDIGTPESNLDLSRRRAESVKQALVERYQISADRLTTGGHGEGAPKATNETPEGRARNRRVELTRSFP